MRFLVLFILTISRQLLQSDGQGSGDNSRPLDACNDHTCSNPKPYCNVIYSDNADDSSECLAKCPSPSIPNGDRICQDYCTQPFNPCADNVANPYCHRQNTGNHYRCLKACTGYLVPASADNICTDACSPNPCNGKVCTPSANGVYNCSDDCEEPKYPDAGDVCIDPCVPNDCPNMFLCKRNNNQRECVVSEDCPDDHYKDLSSNLCIDGCTPNPCGSSKVCTRKNTSPGYECSDNCAYPYTKSGSLCQDPCHPNPCTNRKYCARNGLDYACVSRRNCPDKQYGNRNKRTCEDICLEKPCQNNKFCHRKGKKRKCFARCKPGFVEEENNPYVCEKATTLQSSCTLNEVFTQAYGNSSSPECTSAFTRVLRVFLRAFKLWGALKTLNRGCRKGSVLVDMETDFKDPNVTSTKLTETLISSLSDQENAGNATGSNGTLTFSNLNITIYVNSTVSTDIDECQNEEYYECPDNSTCQNTDGSFICPCDDGFEQLGKSCEEIDDCLNATCDANANCTDEFKGYSCSCMSGYTGNGSKCQDIDECQPNSFCHVNQTCLNYPGGYTCRCPSRQFSVNGTCKSVYSYFSNMTVYQDSVFESRYFSKDKNNQLLDENSNLYHTFGDQFCSLMKSAFSFTRSADYRGCTTSGYKIKKASGSRRSISGADEIDISYEIHFINSHKTTDLSSIITSELLRGNNGYDFFYDMKISRVPISYTVNCGPGETSNGEYCEPDTGKVTDECSEGCAENAQCVLEGGKKLCECIYGYVGDGKTNCRMSDMNRLRWILVGVNTVLLATLIAILFALIRVKKKVTNIKYKSSEVIFQPPAFMRSARSSSGEYESVQR